MLLLVLLKRDRKIDHNMPIVPSHISKMSVATERISLIAVNISLMTASIHEENLNGNIFQYLFCSSQETHIKHLLCRQDHLTVFLYRRLYIK